jgi:carboxyl-terminal processing protease
VNTRLALLAWLTLPALAYTSSARAQDIKCEKDLKKAAELVHTYWSFMIFKPGAFDLKRATSTLMPEAEVATTPEACADVIARFMAHLKDGHSSLQYFPGFVVRTTPEIELRSYRQRMVERPGDRARVRVFVVSRDTADAALAAVMPGSELLAVDGAPVDSLYWWMHDRISGSTEHWRDHLADERLLVGPAESEITLTLRDVHRRIYTVTVRRPPDPFDGDEKARREAAKLEYDTMTVAESKVLDRGWGYLKLKTFAWKGIRETVGKFDEALNPILDRPGIILDLRDNGGGYVGAMTEIAGRFISEKIVLQYLQAREPGSRYVVEFWDPKRGGSPIPPTFAEPRKPIYEGPVIVLIDSGCFSACEGFTGGLQSVGRVTVVGTGPSGGGSGPVTASPPTSRFGRTPPTSPQDGMSSSTRRSSSSRPDGRPRSPTLSGRRAGNAAIR